MRTARQMAVRAIAAQSPTSAATLGATTETDGAIAVGTIAEGAAASTEAATDSAATECAAAGQVQTVTAVHPATMHTPATQAPAAEQQAIRDQIAAFAAVHDAYEQHWSTLTKTELRAADWGRAAAIANHSHPFCRPEELQSVEESAWQAAAMECQQAIRRLQQVKQARLSTAQVDAQEQLVALYHPAKAWAFKQLAEGTPAVDTQEGTPATGAQDEVKGFIEAAEVECTRRSRVQQRSNERGADKQLAQWRDRAQQTMEMARQFGQAAVEAVELLEAALHGWRLQDLYLGIDEKLAVLEAHHSVIDAALPCYSSCSGQVERDNWIEQCEEVEEALQQTKATEARRTQLTMFVNKIKSNERKEQREKSRKILLCNQGRYHCVIKEDIIM